MQVMGVVIGIAVAIFIFLIFRDLVCWYWKINRHIELQEQILVELKKLNGEKVPSQGELPADGLPNS